MIDQEILLDTLREEYPEEVTEIIYSCQFAGKHYLDTRGLNNRLKSLKIFHFNATLSENDWYELVYELTPEIYDDLSYGQAA